MESKGCSFIERVFSTENAQFGHFYINDINGDGNNDIIYTGSSHCSEADITLVWFASPQGYVVKQRSIFQIGLAFLIKKGNSVSISSIESGCCGDSVDKYSIRTLPDLELQKSCRVTKDAHIPKKNNRLSRFVATKDLILRSSPIKDDKYDKEQSEFFDLAMFGNVLSKYLPGCSGKVLGTELDKNSKIWFFVTLDNECKQLRSYVPYDVNVGWISSTK